MTREQMIDQAVRRSMKPVTMIRVDRRSKLAERIRRDCVPHEWNIDDYGPANGAGPGWWVGTIAEHGLRRFPGRVRAIRDAFRH